MSADLEIQYVQLAHGPRTHDIWNFPIQMQFLAYEMETRDGNKVQCIVKNLYLVQIYTTVLGVWVQVRCMWW